MSIGARDLGMMTPEQRATYDAIASGPRQGVPFPFLAMLDAPHLADAIQGVGSAIRFSGNLSPELREIAILATAAAFGSGYEWDYHLAIAKTLNISASVVAACLGENDGADLDPDITATIALCREAVLTRRISTATIDRLVAAVGRPVATEIVAISGYYPLLGLFLSAGGLDHPVRMTA